MAICKIAQEFKLEQIIAYGYRLVELNSIPLDVKRQNILFSGPDCDLNMQSFSERRLHQNQHNKIFHKVITS